MAVGVIVVGATLLLIAFNAESASAPVAMPMRATYAVILFAVLVKSFSVAAVFLLPASFAKAIAVRASATSSVRAAAAAFSSYGKLSSRPLKLATARILAFKYAFACSIAHPLPGAVVSRNIKC